MADKIVKTDAEWRTQLSALAFRVTRRAGTERAFTNDDFPNVAGTFRCICCESPLFDAAAKFDSGTGWPSFYQPINDQAVEEHEDNSWLVPRTEIRCARCDAHLGHVFPDGPAPTGLRYCMNGVAMTFDQDN
ncbi:MAG: peptide-methionine (R)-S-oxide reductase MsrB [Rhodobacteraceae bacterium]|nr:peptide-methionine (R)-S-oxide reductase MsrB [Paracoccaceae bacterium]